MLAIMVATVIASPARSAPAGELTRPIDLPATV
jgi:hypothetical protein